MDSTQQDRDVVGAVFGYCEVGEAVAIQVADRDRAGAGPGGEIEITPKGFGPADSRDWTRTAFGHWGVYTNRRYAKT